MKYNYTLRPFEDGDEFQLNELYNIGFNKNRNIEEWYWKFRNEPLSMQWSIVCIVEGKIVGMYLSKMGQYKLGKKIYLTAHPVETFLHPDFRGAGVQIIKDAYQMACLKGDLLGVVWGLGFPTPQLYKLGTKLFRYKHLFRMPILIKRLNIRLGVKRRCPSKCIEKLTSFVSNRLYKWIHILNQPPYVVDMVIERISVFDAAFDKFWEEASSSSDVIIGLRNTTSLNWRYVESPGSEYVIFVAKKVSKVTGYICLKIEESDGAKIGFIVDFMVIDNSVMSNLLHHAIHYFLKEMVDYVKCAIMAKSWVYSLLQIYSFRDKGKFLHVVYRPFKLFTQIDKEFFEDEKNWFLTYGDTDHV